MSKASTISEFLQVLNHETSYLKGLSIMHQAGCDSFYSLLSNIQCLDFPSYQEAIISGGLVLVEQSEEFRTLAASLGVAFIKENSVILVHSYSRLVMLLLKKASLTRNFKVYVTTASLTESGKMAVLELRKHKIPAALIADAAVGFTMEKVDMVLVGAEGVVRNGGLINQIGTYPVAVMAKICKKPVYCVCERYVNV
jgi:translation initiation factor eIF-2B subunit alpha